MDFQKGASNFLFRHGLDSDKVKRWKTLDFILLFKNEELFARTGRFGPKVSLLISLNEITTPIFPIGEKDIIMRKKA